MGNYGLNAARTVDMITIKKYFRCLTILAVLCIAMRIIWIFDILNIINEDFKDGEISIPTNDPTNDQDPSTDPVTTDADRKNRAISYYIQVKDGCLILHVLYFTVPVIDLI